MIHGTKALVVDTFRELLGNEVGRLNRLGALDDPMNSGYFTTYSLHDLA